MLNQYKLIAAIGLLALGGCDSDAGINVQPAGQMGHLTGIALNIVNTNLIPVDILSAKLNGRKDCVFRVVEKFGFLPESLMQETLPGLLMPGKAMPKRTGRIEDGSWLRILPKMTLQTGESIMLNLAGSPCFGATIVQMDVTTNRETISLSPARPFVPRRDF